MYSAVWILFSAAVLSATLEDCKGQQDGATDCDEAYHGSVLFCTMELSPVCTSNGGQYGNFCSFCAALYRGEVPDGVTYEHCWIQQGS